MLLVTHAQKAPMEPDAFSSGSTADFTSVVQECERELSKIVAGARVSGANRILLYRRILAWAFTDYPMYVEECLRQRSKVENTSDKLTMRLEPLLVYNEKTRGTNAEEKSKKRKRGTIVDSQECAKLISVKHRF